MIIELVKSGSDLVGKGCGDVIEGFLPKNQLKSRKISFKIKISNNFGNQSEASYWRGLGGIEGAASGEN